MALNSNSINQKISDIQNNLANQSINLPGLTTLQKRIEEILILSYEHKTNVVCLGVKNCGKTTLLNALTESFTNNNYDTSSEKYQELLPSKITENTYFTTVVEKSLNSKYSIDHRIVDVLGERSYLQQLNIEFDEVRAYFRNLNNESTEKLNKTNESIVMRLKNEDTVDTQEIPKEIIYLKIPNFPDNLRLIDIPGTSNDIFQNDFLDFLKNKCLMNIFLITKNLTEASVIDPFFISTTNNIIEKYPQSVSLLILTQVDRIISETKQDNLNAYSENLSLFFKYFKEKCKEHRNLGIHILSCEEALKNNIYYKKGVKKLRDKLISFEVFAKGQENSGVINMLNMEFEIFNSGLLKEYCLKAEEIENIKQLANLSKTDYEKKINNLIDVDFSSFNTLFSQNKQPIIELEDLFHQNDKGLKSKYAKRKIYIKDQANLLESHIQEKLINYNLNPILG